MERYYLLPLPKKKKKMIIDFKSFDISIFFRKINLTLNLPYDFFFLRKQPNFPIKGNYSKELFSSWYK